MRRPVLFILSVFMLISIPALYVFSETMFEVMIENISHTPELMSSGVFNTPDGAAEPGALLPGSAYKFSLGATPGSKLSFATMFVQSNDLFYAPAGTGIALFDADGMPISGDITSQIMLWDAGSEVNQEPGIGLDQPPRQAGPNTGADEGGIIQLANGNFTYPNIADVLSVMVTPGADNEFEVSIENISQLPEFSSVGVFNTPGGATDPGPLASGSAYTFDISAAPGSRLSFATMYVQSNDLFYAPGEAGIALFDADGMPISGDITDQVMLWDAGTEINQEPGAGADQAPRQTGPNTGADEAGMAHPVGDGFTYPNIADVLSIMVTPTSDTEFMVSIDNISADDTFLLAPGVWVVHSEDGPIFADGQPDRMEGLEALAEDGDPSGLAASLEARAGVPVLLTPGVWTVHTEDDPLFTEGQPDRMEGLEALAEDGDPSGLAMALEGKSGVPVILAPGVWAVHADGAPLFTPGQPDRMEGLESLAEDGDPSGLEAALSEMDGVDSIGIFNTPTGAAEPGVVTTGSSYGFMVNAAPGSMLSFATMFVQSNDLFYAPTETGIPLFDMDGMPVTGDMTMYVMLWDAGTEVNQRPGVGPDQAPRQAGANTGADEGGDVQLVNDGYTYPDTMDAIRVTISAVPTTDKDYSNVFFMDLPAGLSMISLPLEPSEPQTARSFAAATDSTVVIKYDTAMRKFTGFTPSMPGDGFPIEGGMGYIINRMSAGVVTFVGAAWTNEPQAHAAPPMAGQNSTWAFVVNGKLDQARLENQELYTAKVKNLQTGAVVTDTVTPNGVFTAVFADLSRDPVVGAGDAIEVVIEDQSGRAVAGPIIRQIGNTDIQQAVADLVMRFGRAMPKNSMLLQNYPNPFNPETWIPFQLSEESDVSVRIFDSNGKLVRSLILGRKQAGIYMDKGKSAFWNGRNSAGEEVSSGIYFYNIAAGEFSATRKMIVKK